jgi:hypothetical protein
MTCSRRWIKGDMMKVSRQAILCAEPKLSTRIQDYLSGRLPLAEAIRFETHAKECVECQRNLDLWLFMFEEAVSQTATTKSSLECATSTALPESLTNRRRERYALSR